MKSVVSILALVLFISCVSYAAVCNGSKHAGVTAIYMADSTKAESTAAKWIAGFHERIQQSNSYCLVDDKDKSAMVLSVIGMDADINGNSTAISIAIYTPKDSLFLDHWMYVVDHENLESSGAKAVAALEKEMKELKRLRLLR